MKFLPTFIDNPKFIAFVVVLSVIFVSFFLFLIFKSKIKNQKYLKSNFIITYIFIIAISFSLIFLGISNFNTVGNQEWLTYAFYFSVSLTSIILIIIFLLAMFLLPFRYIYVISFLMEDCYIKRRIINISFFYFINASLAILITCICYFLKDSFFKYDFDINSLQNFGYTSFYYYTRYIFSHVVIKPDFSFYLIISLIAMISLIFIVMLLLRKYNYRLYMKIATKSNNFTIKMKWQDKVMPLFVFTATSSSLLSQPIATMLHISLIIILFTIFSSIIMITNWTIAFKKLHNQIDFRKLTKQTFKSIFTRKVEDTSLFTNLLKNQIDLTNYNLKQKHNYFYKLLSTSIFPIIITGYLGFCSTGPLLDATSPWTYHLWFWLSLFIIPYILSYAYIFSKASTSSCKMLLNMSTAYITSGFNSGILIYFNPIINKISQYAIFSYQLVFLNPKVDIVKINAN